VSSDEREALDRRFVREGLELAARARGLTAPNPMVGAVVVRNGEVVGRGFHERAGTPHAERLALAEAGQLARGAVLYTNMEPCSHHGRTPPCVEAILEAGVRRVVCSLQDPDPRVDGRGFSRLRESGVEVEVGEMADEAETLNEGYLQVKRRGRPFVTGKAALSLDGKLATGKRDSQCITGERARRHAHEIRASVDAVVVGVETLLADDPRLTAREAGSNGPRYRVVLDSRLRTPAHCRLGQEETGRSLVITTPAASDERREGLEAAGLEVAVVEPDARGRVDLSAALGELMARDCSTVLIEGGGELLTGAFEVGIIDKVVLFYAPMLIGGADAPTLWDGQGHSRLVDAPRLTRVTLHRLDPDWAVEGYLPEDPERP